MVLMGHIANGRIVLDGDVQLPEGAQVCVVHQANRNTSFPPMSLRGTQYEYDDPFGPALTPEDLDASS